MKYFIFGKVQNFKDAELQFVIHSNQAKITILVSDIGTIHKIIGQQIGFRHIYLISNFSNFYSNRLI